MTDLASIKTKLQVALRELTARVAGIEDYLSQPSNEDWDENAMESADDEVLEEIEGVTLDEIQQIKFALTRLDAGTYGTCAACGRSIARRRLAALPYATKCIRCS